MSGALTWSCLDSGRQVSRLCTSDCDGPPRRSFRAALQEDADVIGVSSLSGGHRVFVLRILELLRLEGGDPVVVVGGLVSMNDQEFLLNAGVARIFGQGSLVKDIASFLEGVVGDRRAQAVEN